MDAEVIRSPDVADGLRVFLASLNPGLEVTAGSTPPSFAEQSVSVKRTGGYKRDLVTDMAQVLVEARDRNSEAAAEALMCTIDAQIYAGEREGAMGPLTVHMVKTFAGPYLNPDPSNPQIYRCSATYQLAVRMTTA